MLVFYNMSFGHKTEKILYLNAKYNYQGSKCTVLRKNPE